MPSRNKIVRATLNDLHALTEWALAMPDAAVEAAKDIGGTVRDIGKTVKDIGAAAIHLPGDALDKIGIHDEKREQESADPFLRERTEIIVKDGDELVLLTLILDESVNQNLNPGEIPHILIEDAINLKDGLPHENILKSQKEYIIAGLVSGEADGSILTREGLIEASVFPMRVKDEHGRTKVMLQINPLPATPEE